MARKLFEDFMKADEVGDVAESFDAMVKFAELDYEVTSTEFYDRFVEVFQGAVNFRQKKIFTLLKEARAKRSDKVAPANSETRVFVSGAGPCGLRAAVECALLGFKTTVVEKRSIFSRANILMLWPGTKDDLVSLGSKFFYSEMLTHGYPLHLGTREIQLCLLKTALMVGVKVCYESKLVGYFFDHDSQMWCAQVTNADEMEATSGVKGGALDFKPSKLGDYQTTYKCNMVDNPKVDQDFVSKRVKGTALHPFHACIIAEGEWSQTCRSLGVEKTVDKFSQALGVVINLAYDKTNKVESKMQSFANSSIFQKSDLLKALEAKGIKAENIEYLKGKTHYLALTVSKSTLIDSGTLKEDLRSSDLLTEKNLNVDNLKKLAKDACVTIGLPETVEFYKINPVQIFDFSSRARARSSVKYLSADKKTGNINVLDQLDAEAYKLDSEPLAKRAHNAPVFLVGDALLEPFWPQGLGSNRGFHSCLDTAHAILLLQNSGNELAFQERDFSFQSMLALSWSQPKYVLNPYPFWETDYVTRYTPLALKTAYGMVAKATGNIPERFEGMKVVLDMEKKLRLGGAGGDQIYR